MLSIMLLALGMIATPENKLEAGSKALDEFRLDDAIRLLEASLEERGHDHESWVRAHEQLAIAYAYKGRQEDALQAFRALLLLNPGHAIRYDLSPKATLIFEQARSLATSVPAPNIDVVWPRDRTAVDALPIDVEVLFDREQVFHTAELGHRLRGSAAYREIAIDLRAGSPQRIMIPAPNSVEDAVLEIYVRVFDARDNEVLRWATPEQPREIVLRAPQVDPWYGRWWLLAIGGAVVAAGSAGLAYALTRDSAATFDLEAEIRR